MHLVQYGERTMQSESSVLHERMIVTRSSSVRPHKMHKTKRAPYIVSPNAALVMLKAASECALTRSQQHDATESDFECS
jgi:hypothetical protein